MSQTLADATLQDLTAALASHRAGALAAAEQGYRAVLERAPHTPQALRLLGVLLNETGRPVAACEVLRHAATLQPGDADTRIALARACAGSGALVEAASLFRAVLAERPRDAALMLALAHVLAQQNDCAGVLATCHAAVAAAPQNGGTHAALALALLRAGEPDAAADAADMALRCDGSLAVAWLARGMALRALGQATASIPALEEAVRLAPRDAAGWLALGNAQADCDQLDRSCALLRQAIELDPGLLEAHASLASVLTARGALDEAIAACDAALARDGEFAPARWNRGIARMLAGDLAAGWPDIEWRKRHPRFAADFAPLTGAEWSGEAIAGKTLLVHAGQGMGDTIQFARYLPVLVARGAKVVLACAAALAPLMRQIPGVTVVRRADGFPPHDAWVDQMSLPMLLGNDPTTIPAADGYLRADPARVAAWRQDAGAAIRVGLVWAGNPGHTNDRRRSLPQGEAASLLAPLARAARNIPRLRFDGLQVGPRHGELAPHLPVADLSGGLADFAETAAAVATLDLLITVDTATAHLAGAMGKPVWLMLPHAPDWRWQLGRRDTPWYASMRLFRQARPGDWASVVAEVADALWARYAARPKAWTASRPAVAALAVSTVPHAMSTNVIVTDQPFSVARLVRS